MEQAFLAEAFYNALDAQRHAKGLTWKKVAEQTSVSASTLTRIAQGRRPDVDTMAALCRWGGLDANQYVAKDGSEAKQEPLSQITAHLRADKNISPEGAHAMIAMLQSAYEQFRVVQNSEKKE